MNRAEIEGLLDDLGFGLGCIMETIVATRDPDGRPSAAPMGVTRTRGDLLEIKPFKTSATYRNLLRSPEACVNVTDDPRLFLVTAFKHEAERGFAEPVIRRDLSLEAAEAVIFVEVQGSRDVSEERGCFALRARSVEVRRPLPTVFSRGRSQAIEAIVHATRIEAYLRMGRAPDAERLKIKFNECKEVVGRVSSPGSVEAGVIRALEELMDRWGVEASR